MTPLSTPSAPAVIAPPADIAGNEHFSAEYLNALTDEGVEAVLIHFPAGSSGKRKASLEIGHQLTAANLGFGAYCLWGRRAGYCFYHVGTAAEALPIILAALKTDDLLAVATVYQVKTPDQLTILHAPA